MRILLRSAQAPDGKPFSLDRHLGGFGGNLGNLFFADSIYLTLQTPVNAVQTDHYLTERNNFPGSNTWERHLDWVNQEFDSYVLPFADCFRESWLPVLERLANRFTQIKIPMIFCSGGVRLPEHQTFDDLSSNLKNVTKKFLKPFFDSSALVGVRGQITYDYLVYLGFPSDQIQIIGCPSSFFPTYRPQLPSQIPELASDSKITLNQNYLGPDISSFIQNTLKNYPKSSYVGQSLRDFQYTLQYPKTPEPHQFIMPANTFSWIQYMKSRQIVIGTRYHGCVAGLLANTPSLFYGWDSRSRELIEYHQLPQIPCHLDLNLTPIADLIQYYDPRPFHQHFTGGLKRWKNFLKTNGLPNLYDSFIPRLKPIQKILNSIPNQTYPAAYKDLTVLPPKSND